MAQAARWPLIALPGVTLAAATGMRSRSKLLLSLSRKSLSGIGRLLLGAGTADRPVSCVTPLIALGSLSGIGRLLLGTGTADRPVGCDARRRSCVGYTLSIKAAALALRGLSGAGPSLYLRWHR